ncbi:ExeA family protein [Candidatus Venteria ishoeyi]|uniref:LysM domain-containing protein n=2 Tax=Candidatus Venteria ishoeyi TaxID=1899563 RepID=A0A1H6FG50_9GAMM|nr:AAA family ATPase [Candidatus Venteria ishoeyi]MDM8546149.1 AAA family ATPase [Candidatus Venteria ishoeyi]SEH08015.1 Uncharacterised protein [Candidatus Venteria ishoeyi]
MYLTFYGLQRTPFSVTPDPDFLFLSDTHKEALASLVYGVSERRGFILLTGEVGTGKTTVLRSFLETLENGLENKQVRSFYLLNAQLSFFEVLCNILDLSEPAEIKTCSTNQLVQQLYQTLIADYAAGRNVVLIIDEAQHMPVETLEQLRLLSNLETGKDKLLQIILVGQTELEQKLQRFELRQLRQRIAVRAHIKALTKIESLAYIRFRLETAQFNSATDTVPVFTHAAIKYIVKQAQGYPRVINILCDNALITGFGYQQRPVSTKIIKEVLSDIQGGFINKMYHSDKGGAVWRPLFLFILFLILLFFIFLQKNAVVDFFDGKTSAISTKPVAKPEARWFVAPDMISYQKTQQGTQNPASRAVPLPELDSGSSQIQHFWYKIQTGDTIYDLLYRFYGGYSPALFKHLKTQNPQINWQQHIHAGEQLLLTPLPLIPANDAK